MERKLVGWAQRMWEGLDLRSEVGASGEVRGQVGWLLGLKVRVGLHWILAPVGVTGGIPQGSLRPCPCEVARVVMGAGNDLPSAHWRPRKASLVMSSSLSLEA